MKITMEGKYQTRDGRPVRILITDFKGGATCVIGVVTMTDDNEIFSLWSLDGRSYPWSPDNPNDLVLVPVPTKYAGWVIVSNTSGLPLADNRRGIWMNSGDAVAFCNEVSEHVAPVTWGNCPPVVAFFTGASMSTLVQTPQDKIDTWSEKRDPIIKGQRYALVGRGDFVTRGG